MEKRRKLEAKQRAMERNIRKLKRFAIGTLDEKQAKEYKKQVRAAQKELREFISQHSGDLVRDYGREKVYNGEAAPPTTVSPETKSEPPESADNAVEVTLPSGDVKGDYEPERVPEKEIEKGLTGENEGGIIIAGSDIVFSEDQRYGRNKDTLVNKTYILSGEYRRKFDNATDNDIVNKTLYQCAKEALKHRSGTEYEDMYWIDGNTGKVCLSITDSTEKQAIIYTDRIKKSIEDRTDIVTIHTHPNSMPPSVSDLNSNFTNGYAIGFVACHNGTVFGYTSGEYISEKLNELYIQKFLNKGCDEYEAQVKSLEKLSETFDITIWEVNYDG